MREWRRQNLQESERKIDKQTDIYADRQIEEKGLQRELKR